MSVLPTRDPLNAQPYQVADCHSLRLPCSGSSVKRARDWVRWCLEGWRVPEDPVFAVVQVVSELATNAVTHVGGEGGFGVVVALGGGRITVAVVDGGGGAVIGPRVVGPDDEGGRGLAYVAVVADAWGTARVPAGTCVWATVPLPGDGGELAPEVPEVVPAGLTAALVPAAGSPHGP